MLENYRMETASTELTSIWRRNENLFVTGVVISDASCGIYILFGQTFSLLSGFWLYQSFMKNI